MHTRRVFPLIGLLLFFLGLSMSLPLLVSLIYHDSSARPLVFSILLCCTAGLTVFFLSRGEQITHLSHRDGVAIVTLGWLAAGLAGALPFVLSGAFDNFTDAYFESLSGFTTTGASVLNNIEALPPGILMWRSLTQWLGGMGIIVLSIAILPFLA